MAEWNDNQTRQGFGTAPGQAGDVQSRTSFDAGLRKHMLSIYNYMASGVLLTGLVAMLLARAGMVSGAVLMIGSLGSLGIVFAMSFGRDRFSTGTLQAMFWAYAVLMGMAISYIFIVYTGPSIAMTFFAAAGAFAGLSLWGYTTQKDISGWGSFLIMGVIGLILASLLNIGWAFFTGAPISGLDLAISALGVLVFAGLTAYDTQRLKHEYLAISQMKMTNPAVAEAYPMGKLVIMGALTLYLDFINMFLFLLRFMGAARE
ncbi:Bax inhibitor-1/YccA family protein [Aurantiacibacter sp. D1-12]|uniref:Bax inhibitor-1/YccA family protein n=1 Tax=Aurantiacibacter sp. D1-12 TaxID=2993658 RepID=UPI00237CB283|nr:Bax inhibitor-1/YccA family protein [Aurantiacibacter sp. D1-12]MDE1466938.1 Bax inhibitor-1/YccA family protein [Aurantiacibacter sp. D1-12]